MFFFDKHHFKTQHLGFTPFHFCNPRHESIKRLCLFGLLGRTLHYAFTLLRPLSPTQLDPVFNGGCFESHTVRLDGR